MKSFSKLITQARPDNKLLREISMLFIQRFKVLIRKTIQ